MKKTFKKNERLCSKKDIENLFDRNRHENESLFSYPFRVVYTPTTADTSKVIFSVSKRNFKKATIRNLIRRRTREAYRLNKHLLGQPVHIIFIYISKEIEKFAVIEKSIKSILRKISTAK